MAEIDKLTVTLALDTELVESLISAVVEISEKADALVKILAVMSESKSVDFANTIVLGVDGAIDVNSFKPKSTIREFR